MKYGMTFFSPEHDHWGLGFDPSSKRNLLGIPVSNAMVDYIESHCLEPTQYRDFLEGKEAAAAFAGACRRRGTRRSLHARAWEISRNPPIAFRFLRNLRP